MPNPTVLLSTLINRMNRWQAILPIEEQLKVRDLDDALRTIKRSNNLPFYQKKGSLRVFEGVYEYPPAADHDYLIYIDYTNPNVPYGQRLRARYTSMQQFYEDPDYRNSVAEIWTNNSLMLGVRDNDPQFQGAQSQVIDTAQSTDDHTVTGDASNLRIDNVNFITGDASLAFNVVNSLNIAGVQDTFEGFTDSDYKRKYYFRYVYLGALPTSIQLRFGADSSNYLHGTVTTQFSGIPLVANQWNFVAINLNDATTVGTVNTSTVFAYEAINLNGAPTGIYNIDASYLKRWVLMDYWYYSKFAVQTDGSTEADQQYFYNSSETYSTDSALVGVEEWADVVMYEAMCNSLIDQENGPVLVQIQAKRELAWEKLREIWPSSKPQMTTNRYRFGTDYTSPAGNGYYPYA